MSLSSAPTEPGLAARILMATPVIGHVIRDVSRDINTIFYLLTILVTVLVFAIKAWGLGALVVTAVAFVPCMFALLIWITLP